MNSYKIGDKVYRTGEDGKIHAVSIFSIYQTANFTYYNAHLGAHQRGFRECYPSEIEALQAEIDKLKEKQTSPSHSPYAQDAIQNPCAHQWIMQEPGQILTSNPPQMMYECLRCGHKEAKIVGEI